MAQIKSAPGGQLTTLNNQLAIHVDDGADSEISKWVQFDDLLAYIQSETNKTNDIIDGNFDFWLAGNTSVVGIANNVYCSDMIKYKKNGTMIEDTSRDASIIPTGANYSLKSEVTTAQASIGAGNFNFYEFVIEGYNIQKYIINGNFTIGFKVRANQTGTFCVAIRNDGLDRSYVKEYTIQSADTWEPVILTFPMNFSGGTWDYTNGVGLYISICKAGGSTFQTTANSWQTGNYFATSNQDNFVDQIGNTFNIALLSGGAGTQEIGFDGYDYSKELLKLNRYYEKSYNSSVAPGTITTSNAGFHSLNYTLGASSFIKIIEYRERKRITNPTITIYSPTTGISGNVRNTTLGSDQPVSINGVGETQYILANNSGTFNDQDSILYYYTVDARF